MNKRWLINLILLAAIALMALLLTLRPGKQAEEKYTLTTLNKEDIDRITLLRPTRDKLVLDKLNNRWQLTAPVNARSNRFNVSNLLKLAGTESSIRFAANDKALAQYGLDKPAASIILNDVTLKVGSSHPIKQERYVQAGNWVYLVAINRLRMSENPYTDFISSALIEEDAKLTGLNLGQQQLVYQDGKWSLTPENKAVSGDNINQFVNEWRLTHALSVDRYNNKPVEQWLSITLHKQQADKAGPTRTDVIKLGVVSYKPEFVLYRPDEKLEYRFSEDTGKRLLQLKPDEKKTD